MEHISFLKYTIDDIQLYLYSIFAVKRDKLLFSPLPRLSHKIYSILTSTKSHTRKE